MKEDKNVTVVAETADLHNNDGNSYRLLPIKHERTSPFENVPRIKLGVTTQEIVEILHECRAEM
ncbi:MAG: hypothetical protein FWG66_06430 [Spirochaetes bacterium]|nr:hypothetical protein [Spirochaetota bacterium]